MKHFKVGAAMVAFAMLLAIPTMVSAGLCNLATPPCPGTGPCGFTCTPALVGCPAAIPVAHQSAASCPTTPGAGGSFDLINTIYETTCGTTACIQLPPPVRFWGYNIYSTANYGCGWPGASPGFEWMVNLGADFGIGANGHWAFYQSNWQGCALDGCATPAARTVAEITDVVSTLETTVTHDAFYLVASVNSGAGGYNFDRILGAGSISGCSGSDVPESSVNGVNVQGRTAFCTGTTTVTQGTTNAVLAATGDIMVSLETPTPDWFTEVGYRDATTPLISGYQIMYVVSAAEPTSSDASVVPWQPVHDPANPANRLGIIPTGTATPFTVTVPKPPAGQNAWLAARIVYADATVNPIGTFTFPGGPVLTSAVSNHCGPINFTVGPVLSVNFDSVTAVRTSAGVLVKWSTSYEDDVTGYAVMRKPAGSTEAAIEVSGPDLVPTLASKSYEFVDNSADAGASFTYYIQEFTDSGDGDRSPEVNVVNLNDGPSGGRNRKSLTR